MNPDPKAAQASLPTDPSVWKKIVLKYQIPATGRATWQVLNTLIPYTALWCLMYWSVGVSYWITVPLAVLAAGFLVRVFIILHDCGHGSFLKSRRANDILGFIMGVVCFTPYFNWRWEHSVHHSTSGDLDKRGLGDVWTLTVQEYLESSRWKRFAYRLARNPIILFVIAPLFLFLIKHRFAQAGAGNRERESVQWTNLSILIMAIGMSQIFGLETYVLLQLMILTVAGTVGVWMFYVQHQFEDVYWEHHEEWDYTAAALQGSSFYKLPKILQWFSGNIGFHHIHHLSPRIPNYHLEKCHESEPLFQTVQPLTLFKSFKSLTFRLWDEQQRKLVGYRHLRMLRRQQKQTAQS